MPISKQFLTDRITAQEAIVIALQEALNDLATGKILSYTLDTGQNRQTVTRNNITELRKALDSALNLLSTLCATRDGTGVLTGRPGF